MLKKNEFSLSNNSKSNYFGILMDHSQYLQIQEKFDLLKERAPSRCSMNLNFVEQAPLLIGTLTIETYSHKFHSRNVNYTPLEAYKSLEKDIDYQLLKWKQRRFSPKYNDSLKNMNFDNQLSNLD